MKKSLLVEPGKISGTIVLPSSKSHTLRALIFALFASGKTKIDSPLISKDVDSMIHAIENFGAKVVKKENCFEVEGAGGRFSPPEDVINSGNSGIVYRFITAASALFPYYTVITGDESIRKRRPISSLLQGLNSLGVFTASSRGDNKAPLIIKGPMQSGMLSLDGEDSQLVSAMLIAAPFAKGPIEIFVNEPKELPWIELTLSWLKLLKIPFERRGFTYYKTYGGASIEGFNYAVPGDLSSLAFPLAASIITQSTCQIERADLCDVQGDKIFVFLLQKMGACIEIDHKHHRLEVLKSPCLQGGVIDCDSCIDAVPILAALGCFCQSPMLLKNCLVARSKESDRLFAITQELRKMGAKIEESQDALTIFPSPLKGAKVFSHGDHRIAMSLCVAALGASGETWIDDVECIGKTFPSFTKDLQNLGAKLCEI